MNATTYQYTVIRIDTKDPMNSQTLGTYWSFKEADKYRKDCESRKPKELKHLIYKVDHFIIDNLEGK